MRTAKCLVLTLFVTLLAGLVSSLSAEEKQTVDPVDPRKGTAAPKTELTRPDKALINDTKSAAVAQTKATFQAKFDEYKSAIREIEKLQAEFQTADEATRERLNAKLSGQVTHAQSLVNAMVEAAVAAYRAAPNADPQITTLLTSVAKHYTIGRQVGPGQPSQRNP